MRVPKETFCAQAICTSSALKTQCPFPTHPLPPTVFPNGSSAPVLAVDSRSGIRAGSRRHRDFGNECPAIVLKNANLRSMAIRRLRWDWFGEADEAAKALVLCEFRDIRSNETHCICDVRVDRYRICINSLAPTAFAQPASNPQTLPRYPLFGAVQVRLTDGSTSLAWRLRYSTDQL